MIRRLTAAAFLSLTASAFGHIFWIQPTSFRPAKDELVKIDLRVGDGLPGEVKPRNNQRIVEFKCYTAKADHELLGFDGRAPAAMDRFAEEGPHILAYRSNNAFIELAPEKFDTYIAEEGLTTIAKARAAAPAKPGDVREAYSRCAKAIVNVGGKPAQGFDRVVGLDLEIIPLTDPATLKPGDTAVYRILWKGKPAPDVRVSAHYPGQPKRDSRTDSDGKATFTLDQPGMWIIETLEMHEAPEGVKAQYESVWSSLSFEVQPPIASPTTTEPPKPAH